VVALLAFFGLGAILTVVPAAHDVGIVEHSITLLRPVRPDGRQLLSQGVVIHNAGGFVVSTVEVTDEDGNRIALGYQTGVLRQRRQHRTTASERVLATVLFTDIVGSTSHAEHLGDSRWRQLLDEHHAAVRRELRVFKGREVKTTGDGFLATFDSPGRAVQAARGIRDSVRRLGLEIRAGLHTGECEISGADVAGIAVHIAARVQALADDGEIIVTSTVRDLVAGSGLRFSDRDTHPLKGIDGDWHLFSLAE
jgi:class 3 adenylate cyclase